MDTSYDTFKRPISKSSDDGKSDEDEATFTFEEAIEHIGFGRFQLKLAFICGLAWIADSMEIMVLSILGAVLSCDWGISTSQQALITTIVFCGFLIGSPLLGSMADKFGRKTSLIFCSIWGFYFGILSGMSPNYVWLLLLRLLTGIGVAGTPQVVTYYAEFLPVKSRGKCLILQEIFWAFGAFVEVILAILLIPNFGWEWWMMASSVPLLVFAFLVLMFPESARYRMVCGDDKTAMTILQSVAQVNKVDMLKGTLIAEKEKSRGKLKDLFSPLLRRTTFLLGPIWFISAFSYYGIILLSTELIRLPSSCLDGGIQLSAIEEQTCPLECVGITSQGYTDLLWTSLAEVPGLVITAFLVDVIGRRWSLRILFLLTALMCGLLFICMTHTALIALLFTARALIASASQVAFVYTPEVYPTEVRALAMGIFSGFARFGALVTPFVAQVLLEKSTYIGLGVYAAAATLAGILSFILPYETKGHALQESH